MSETVKVIRFYKTGESDVLRIDEIQLSQLKENEVLVRVQAIAVSRLDLLWRAGSYFEEPEFPAKIGYDAAGIVVSVGPEVKTIKVGDRVSTFPAVSLLDYGAHGETIIYPETALIVLSRKPDPGASGRSEHRFVYCLLRIAGTRQPQKGSTRCHNRRQLFNGNCRNSNVESHRREKHRGDAFGSEERSFARSRSGSSYCCRP
jgi:Alcohol dehydrogenase GroES-like domain